MAREINKLSARKVATMTTPGRHADGGGLYLVVDENGGKRWVMLYRMDKKRHEMGLGPLISVPLAKARDLAAEARAQIQSGTNPLKAKAAAKVAPTDTHVTTFADVARAYMADHEKIWRNAVHRAQWRQTLETQATALWNAPVAEITTDDVLGVLRPMWHEKPETARRIRGRIERVMDAARALKMRDGENPARWRGHLDSILPQSQKLSRGHFAAMPYSDVPTFYAELCEKSGHSAMAMRLAILTAGRSGEVRGMPWGEIDMANALWTVPAERMKGKRVHRVPLSAPALAILAQIRPDKPDPQSLVLPSQNSTRLSDMALLMLLRKSGRGAYTAHGFRSSFRDWVDEATDVPGEVAEAALAHLTGDETERAYRRGDALEKRRSLMDQWAAFVTNTEASLTNASRSA